MGLLKWEWGNDICTGAKIGPFAASVADFSGHDAASVFEDECPDGKMFRLAFEFERRGLRDCTWHATRDEAHDFFERWLAEHVLAPLLPLRSLLPVPDGCVRVRAAVSMTRDGSQWSVHGSNGATDSALDDWLIEWVDGEEDEAGFITADVPIPRVPEVTGEVER